MAACDLCRRESAAPLGGRPALPMAAKSSVRIGKRSCHEPRQCTRTPRTLRVRIHHAERDEYNMMTTTKPGFVVKPGFRINLQKGDCAMQSPCCQWGRILSRCGCLVSILAINI